MAKKKDEKDVLVVRDEKTGEISVVAGLNADGSPKRIPAKAENSQSFLQFDRHGDDPQRSRHYVRLVNDRAFDRVAGYLRQGKILTGGRTDRSERYIEPTLLAEVDPDAPVMREEIFGPVLPVIPFDTAQQAVDFVTSREKPLALYYFGPERTGRDVLLHTSSGGACLNDTIMHIANEQIPFGGVGNSGMGRYHGRDSFDAFSHRRATVTTPTWIDPPFRYMPYRFFRWVKRIL